MSSTLHDLKCFFPPPERMTPSVMARYPSQEQPVILSITYTLIYMTLSMLILQQVSSNIFINSFILKHYFIAAVDASTQTEGQTVPAGKFPGLLSVFV